MIKKIFISILFLSIAGFLFFWFFFKKEEKNISYRFDKISRGDIQVVVTATGTLSALQTVQVGTQVSGTVAKLFVDFNEKVKEGQIVAQIDPTFLEAQVKDAKANLQKTSAQLNEAKLNFRRIKLLLQKQLSSQQEYEAALAQYEITQAARKQSEAQLERAKINLRYTTIKSPIDGVVISRQVDVGQTVAASFASPTLFTVANDLTKMQVQTNVDEADIGKVKIGQQVFFTVDAYPEIKFMGTLRQVRLVPTTIQNVVTYTVIIDVPNVDLKLMPGMTATVSILIDERKNVLKIPSLAFRFEAPESEIEKSKKDSIISLKNNENGKNKLQNLWILNKNKKLVSVYLETGISDGTYTEIIDGKVSEGNEFVVGVIKDKIEKTVNPFSPNQSRPQTSNARP